MVSSVYEQHISPAEYDGTNDPSFSLKHSVVRRRYSDFVTLREILFRQHSCIKPPHLPGKSLFKNRFTDAFIEKRREGLENFLNKISLVPIYLSNKAVHLFLQSTFSMDEIKDIIKGNSLDFSIAVDYILTKNANARVQEVNSVGYEEFSKYDSLTAFEVVCGDEGQESCAYSTDVPEEVTIPSASSEHSLQPSVRSVVKKVSFSDKVVVALVHRH